MTLAIVITSGIWIAFAFMSDKEPSRDYAINILWIMQFATAVGATLIVWLVYFALT